MRTVDVDGSIRPNLSSEALTQSEYVSEVINEAMRARPRPLDVRDGRVPRAGGALRHLGGGVRGLQAEAQGHLAQQEDAHRADRVAGDLREPQGVRAHV